MLSVRYGNRRLEMKPGKPAIEVGDLDSLVPTLNLVREAAGAGELDKLMMAAKASRVIRHAPQTPEVRCTAPSLRPKPPLEARQAEMRTK